MKGAVDPNGLLPARRAYYRYEGSLTIPPCSETVNWLVLAERIEVAEADIARVQNPSVPGELDTTSPPTAAPAQDRFWHFSDLPRCPLSRPCQGHSGHQTRLIRATPIYEYTA